MTHPKTTEVNDTGAPKHQFPRPGREACAIGTPQKLSRCPGTFDDKGILRNYVVAIDPFIRRRTIEPEAQESDQRRRQQDETHRHKVVEARRPVEHDHNTNSEPHSKDQMNQGRNTKCVIVSLLCFAKFESNQWAASS